MHELATSRAQSVIENLDLDPGHYAPLAASPTVRIDDAGTGNLVLVKGGAPKAKLQIRFGPVHNCRVYLGAQLQGSLTIGIHGDDSVLHIGDDCQLAELQIRSKQRGDFIAIGQGVTTTARNTWISGPGAGDARPWLIVGDDCMFAYDIVIRNSDAHPIYDLDTQAQVNEPSRGVCLEPHVWVGEDVKILKDVTIGAGSIVALGSIVTRDVPRHSVARGVPAQSVATQGRYWSRNELTRARERAQYFVRKYPA